MKAVTQFFRPLRLDVIRSYKIVYKIYNLFKYKELAYLLPLYKKWNLRKRYFSTISSNDFKSFPKYEDHLLTNDSKKVLPKNPTFQKLPKKYQNELINWSENGFAHFKGFISEETIDHVDKIISKRWNKNFSKWRFGDRRLFAIHEEEFLWNFAEADKVTEIISMLLGTESEIFDSINFQKGSNQPTHSDSYFITTFPLGNIIGVWFALEDIHPDSGPLHYFPGSHKLPYILNSDINNEGNRFRIGAQHHSIYENKIQEIIKERKLEKKILLAKKGDVLIWHGNLLHGGEIVRNKKLTRKSMVCHYYAKDVICYHEITQRPALKKKPFD